jgi:threonine dehydratase
VAQRLGKRATIFVAKRKDPHARSLMAKRLGAQVLQVSPGYLTVVHKRAESYAQDFGARLAPFGFDTPEATVAIAEAARLTDLAPDEVWCAAGSGVLARGLAKAFPQAARFAVQIGRDISGAEAGGATVIKHPLEFGQACRAAVPFPSDPHYDAKAWEICQARHGAGTVLFWNVTGPAA